MTTETQTISDVGIPSMIFYGQHSHEMETAALAIAKYANLSHIKITPKNFPSSAKCLRSKKFLAQLDQLLNTHDVDSSQRRLVLINGLTGLEPKYHSELVSIVASAKKGYVIFLTDHDSRLPNVLRQAIPSIGFNFNTGSRADAVEAIVRQFPLLSEQTGIIFSEESLQAHIGDKLTELRTANFKRIRKQRHKSISNPIDSSCFNHLLVYTGTPTKEQIGGQLEFMAE